MPKRSKVNALPKAVREWIDKALIDSNFSGYERLEAHLNQKGYEISKSSLHRYGKAFDRQLKAIKLANEKAKAIVESMPDEDGSLGESVSRVLQQKAFDVAVDIEVDPKKLTLTSLMRAVGELNRSSIAQKKWQQEMKEKVRLASEQVKEATRQAGVSKETIELIEKTILGIV